MSGGIGTKRITVSLPVGVVDQLDFVSKKFQLSRSALLSGLLTESLPTLVQVAEAMPDDLMDVSDSDARRFRGETAKTITELVEKLTGAGDQLDAFK